MRLTPVSRLHDALMTVADAAAIWAFSRLLQAAIEANAPHHGTSFSTFAGVQW
jgi:hypothetical protein